MYQSKLAALHGITTKHVLKSTSCHLNQCGDYCQGNEDKPLMYSIFN